MRVTVGYEYTQRVSVHELSEFSTCTLSYDIGSPVVVNNDKCKKLQFIHAVNGDGSKTAKIIKRQC